MKAGIRMPVLRFTNAPGELPRWLHSYNWHRPHGRYRLDATNQQTRSNHEQPVEAPYLVVFPHGFPNCSVFPCENTIRFVDVHLDISLAYDRDELVEVDLELSSRRVDLLKRSLLPLIDKKIEISRTSERLLKRVVRFPILAKMVESRPESGDNSTHGRREIGIIEKEIGPSLQFVDTIEHDHCRVVEICRHVQDVLIEQRSMYALQEPAQVLDVARPLDLLGRYF